MEILRIEPTPSPNTMKVVLSYTREDKLSNTYKKVEENQPRFINQLLSIDGITSIFHVMNFLAVDKAPKADWEDILPDIKAAFSGESQVLESGKDPQIDNHFGEIKAEYKGLRDKSPAVRRTAGDCISDLGYPEALPEMVLLLDDPQKIVRWRAAMFIFDEGNAEQLPALKAHINDNAFEVKLQIEMAISRIENGDEALGSVWKQMTNRTI
ncbi:TPA: NifU N-terminal domain-containing protein [Staphylococcus aureus]|uniref:NifU N-terminal domain-containing protein n=1 Tax=Staphylococcus aureus TaxID=1280 RepID=UPI00136376EB|nr:NifU N-terminal domain-containing protein [Staphylococcus aureus]NGG19201.1 hypothetical protein [Staphylococcus aureus]QHK82719.1 hypothetical protein E3T04_06140 [Staphylococcus aureus]HCY9840533.1 NifU N-terminal domain-containing protein [Staphylococcus aureus]HCY9840657.1 NifU N-terminal domain-containing protein [Staphylococcus aureus]HDI8266930.1 NifU N-terminal domain-containing protein [Staphylococcus aureus]